MPVYLPQPPCSLAVARTMTFLMDPVDSGTSQTRAVTNSDGTLTITFDDFDPGMLAGPTSAGENLYSYQGYPQVTTIYDNTPEEYLFLSMFNTVGGSTEYSSGGIALSNWNIRSNQSGNTGDWWYSYLNQCSVYNTAVEAEGQGKEAGHSGSNFGVVYGYVDAYNQAWMAKPEFYFNVPPENWSACGSATPHTLMVSLLMVISSVLRG